MFEYRVRTKRSDAWVEKYKGSMLNPQMIAVTAGPGPTRILKPNGDPLLVYLPGALKDLSEEQWADFSAIRGMTSNRGMASGGKRKARPSNVAEDGSIRPSALGHVPRTSAPTVSSSILGAIDMDRTGTKEVICRLTAFNATEVETWTRMLPVFREIARHFEEQVPDRYKAQVARATASHEDWIIEGTPFSTITINNTYPTGLHTDKGDLDEGFSTLGVFRRGDYTGGILTFPQYGVGADMQDGDLLLMDAHEWHGNTPLLCSYCGESLRKFGHTCPEGAGPEMSGASPERVSIVSYYRTQIEQCDSMAAEDEKRAAIREDRMLRIMGIGDATA